MTAAAPQPNAEPAGGDKHPHLQHALNDVAEARRAHERLQADIGRMENAVRQAKADAIRIRSEAVAEADRRRIEIDALAEQSQARLAEAVEKIRLQQADIDERRAELTRFEEFATTRLAEFDQAKAELDALRATIAEERTGAQRIIDEALPQIDKAEERASTAIDLRDQAIDLRARELSAREAELEEWELELIERTRKVESSGGASAARHRLPPASGAGWGRRSQTG